MMDRRPPDLFAQPPVRSDFVRRKWGRPPRPLLRWLMLAALLAGAAVGFSVYWFFGSAGEEAPAEIPVIKAEGETKIRPEKPGGLEIPHQEETVFQQIDKGASDKPPAVERLLPPPPVPQEQAPPAAAETAAVPVSPIPATSAPASALPSAEPVSAGAPVPSVSSESLSSAAAAGGAKAGKVEKLEAPVSLPAAGSAPKPEESAATGGALREGSKPAETGSIPKEMFLEEKPAAKGFFVQLGSFPDKKKAQAEMEKLQKKYSDTLGKAGLQVKRADLGAKGTYYRIQSRPMTDPEARSICAKLWSRKAPCIVVRP